MIRVEFIGLPGSGKSFIRDRLVHCLKKYNKDKYITSEEAMLSVSRTRMDRIYRLMLKCLPDAMAIKLSNNLMGRSLMQFQSQNRFLAKNGKSFETFLSSVEFDDLSIEDRENVIGSFILTGSTCECLMSGPLSEDTVVFFEEGLVQKSFMFISSSTVSNADKNNVLKYLNHIPLPDLVVYVQSDIATCHERMMARKQGLIIRLRNADKEQINEFLIASDNHLKTVADWLESESTVNLLHVDNNMEIDLVIQNLQNSIRDI